MKSTGQRIRELRQEKNLTLKDLATQAGISIGFLGDIESDRTRPSINTLHSLATVLDVTTDRLLGLGGIIICPVCNLHYSSPEDEEEHKRFHEAYLEAVEKFGPIMHYVERERVKREAYQMLRSPTAKLTDKLKVAEQLLKAYFSRSVEEHKFDLRHPQFKDYVATSLNEDYWRQFFSGEIYEALVKKYGTKHHELDIPKVGAHTGWLCCESPSPYGLDTIPVGRRIKLPVIGVVKAGPNGLAYEEPLGEEWADEEGLNGAKHYYLKIKGDSMIGDGILPGDLALIREQPDVEGGEIAVVIINNDEGTIKRVIKTNNSIVLQASNPSYPPRVFSGLELENLRIVGKVKEIKRKY